MVVIRARSVTLALVEGGGCERGVGDDLRGDRGEEQCSSLKKSLRIAMVGAGGQAAWRSVRRYVR